MREHAYLGTQNPAEGARRQTFHDIGDSEETVLALAIRAQAASRIDTPARHTAKNPQQRRRDLADSYTTQLQSPPVAVAYT